MSEYPLVEVVVSSYINVDPLFFLPALERSSGGERVVLDYFVIEP